jgi:DNA-binding NtrC family response regulator
VTQSRILPFLGPAAALYLIAHVASVVGGLTTAGVAVAAVAVLCMGTPWITRRQPDAPGAGRVAWLGMAGGAALLGAVEPRAAVLPLDVVSRVAAVAAGGLVLDLGLCVPRSAAPRRLWRLVVVLSALVCGALGLLAVLPLVSIQGYPVLVPQRLGDLPYAYALATTALALMARLWRRRGSDDPLALASNAWATLGLAPAMVLAGMALVLRDQGQLEWMSGAAVAAVVIGLVGHVAMVDPARRLHVDRAARHAVASLLTLAVMAALGVAFLRWLPPTPGAYALALAGSAVLAALLHRATVPVAQRVLAPDGSRLLSAVDRIEASLLDVRGLEDLGRRVLGPLRDASRSPEATPVLYAVHPPLEIRIDAAREAHVRERPLSETILSRLLEQPTEIIVRGALEGHVVRRPELRSLVDATGALDALCVVPLRAEGELEGALVVPRGRRRSLPSIEELRRLEGLGGRVASLLVLLSAQERARRRTADALRAQDDGEERIEALEDEVARLRTEARVLRAGKGASRLAAPPVAYGPAMRALRDRIAQVGPLEAPVLLVAEGGTAIDQVALWVHEESGRSDGPFVVADCASVRPEDSMAALFGTEGDRPEPGWVQMAGGGTLVLADMPALSIGAQAALAEALGTRRATTVGGSGAYPVNVRVVATTRRALDRLVPEGAVEPELARWLGKVPLSVPPLRDRREDIPSLALLALDRACRVLGRPTMGMDQKALEVLLRHDWPGNLRELQHVVAHAVAGAEGAQVTVQDLPALAPSVPATDPLEGTYAAIEKRALRRALERAGGNKSQAARQLGLKRTTFLDKLRRHQLDDEPKAAERSS